MNTPKLPLTRDLLPAYRLSWLVALLMALSSLFGLLFPTVFYPTQDLRHASIPTDIVNLVIGLPILLAAMILARRGVLIGLLFWPGMLLFAMYHAVAFAAGVPFTRPFYLYVLLAALSVSTLVRLLTGIDPNAVQQRLRGKVPEHVAGGALIGMGLLFAGLVSQIIADPASLPSEVATGVADLTVIPLLVIGGVLLWRRQAWGYAVGPGLLFLISMLFIGLLAIFILQPIVAGVPFPLVDFVIILVMGLISFIPLGLFINGILSSTESISHENEQTTFSA